MGFEREALLIRYTWPDGSAFAGCCPHPRRRLPHGRAWNVGSRTVHLAATGTLLGGHVFGVPADALLPWLWVGIASGAVMLAVELYTSFDWLTQVGGLAVVLKLALLCAIPFAWSARVPILFAVVAVAGVGVAHARQVPALLGAVRTGGQRHEVGSRPAAAARGPPQPRRLRAAAP